MHTLFIDVETFSGVDLKESGTYKYIESPDFEILIIGFAYDDGPVHVYDLMQNIEYVYDGENLVFEDVIDGIPEQFIKDLKDPKILKVAHNASFERRCFKRIGIHTMPIDWYCTLVKAGYCGLPLSLDKVSKALKLTDSKLATGKTLIRYFSCLNKSKTKGLYRHYPEDDLNRWEQYMIYNVYDVLAEREIYNKLSFAEIPRFERELYQLDQIINDTGIYIDMDLAEKAIELSTENSVNLLDRVKSITGLDNPNSLIQLKAWLKKETGKTFDSLSAESVKELLNEYKEGPVHEVLAARRSLGKSSVKKYAAMLNCANSDHRVRGTFQFYGAARTGRWAGRLVQLHNLPRNYIQPIDVVREDVKAEDLIYLDMLYGDISNVLSQLVRTCFIPEPGKKFLVADFSAIEARVISWLAKEPWRMEVFHGNGKIYEATGAKMFHVPIESITKGSELRQKAKIAELALGYGGSVGALSNMGGEKMGLSTDEMKDLTKRWRDANSNIVALWEDLELNAKRAITHKRSCTAADGRIVFSYKEPYLSMRLPSGRELYYYKAHLKNEYKFGRQVDTIYYRGEIPGTSTYGDVDTYGGKLTENAVQAIARDLLANSMMNLGAAGYTIVMHVHDEVIVECADDNLRHMIDVMTVVPDWANDLPLKAEGFVSNFYMKD